MVLLEATARRAAGARVVLTRRDPDAWYDSVSNTVFQSLRADSDDRERVRRRVSTRNLIFTQTFRDRIDREHVVSVLRAHERT